MAIQLSINILYIMVTSSVPSILASSQQDQQDQPLVMPEEKRGESYRLNFQIKYLTTSDLENISEKIKEALEVSTWLQVLP